MQKRFFWAGGLFMVLLLSVLKPGPVWAGTQIVPVISSEVPVAGGNSFPVLIRGEGLQGLYALEAELHYNPQFSRVLPGGVYWPQAVWGDGVFGVVHCQKPGVIGFMVTSTGDRPGFTGSGTLARIDFQPLAAGGSEIYLKQVCLLNRKLEEMPFQVKNALLMISPDNPFFTDLNGHWAQAVIEEMVWQGLTAGYPDGTYRPNISLSRIESIAFLDKMLRAAGDLTDGSLLLPYLDAGEVPDWARGSLAAVTRMGLVGGYPDGTFRPEKPVSRNELAVMLLRVAEFYGLLPVNPPSVFTDLTEVPSWAREAVSEASRQGLVSGKTDGTWDGNRAITRAEAAAMFSRLFHRLEAG